MLNNLTTKLLRISISLAMIMANTFALSQAALSDGATENATFSFTPTSGYVKPSTEFTVDILIDTKATPVTLARAVITFDPTIAKVTKAEKNDTMFCLWPADEQSLDNANGVVMLTGFCQSSSTNSLYATSGDADVYARLTFLTLKEGNLNLTWEYTGQDEAFKSVIIAGGSPTRNILNSKPLPASFIVDKNAGQAPATNQGGTTFPVTGVFEFSKLYLGLGMIGIAALVTFASGLLWKFYSKSAQNKNKTVVVYE